MKKPLVSVVMAVYNAERFLLEAIQSVIDQTYDNYELIVVDDASTDKTMSLLRDCQTTNPKILIKQLENNSGAGISRNEGIKLASGDIIAFLDSDDKWLPEKLEKQVDYMLENDCEVVFSSYTCMDEEGALLGKKIEALPKLTYKKLLKCNYIGNLTGAYSVAKLGKIYAPSLRKRQDWALWLTALKKCKVAYGLQEPLAIYRVREDSISSNKYEMVGYNYKVYKTFLGFSTLKSIFYMLMFLREYFFVKSKQTELSVE